MSSHWPDPLYYHRITFYISILFIIMITVMIEQRSDDGLKYEVYTPFYMPHGPRPISMKLFIAVGNDAQAHSGERPEKMQMRNLL